MRAAAALPDRDPVRGPHRLSRLRGAGGGARRARAHRQRSRSARCAGHAQPRPAHVRGDHPAGVQHHVSAGIVLPLAGRRDGGARRARHAGRERARAYRASLSARHAPPLWRAGDVAPARGRGPPLGLPAVLALAKATACSCEVACPSGELGLLPSPLWGGVGGGVPSADHHTTPTPRASRATLPTRGRVRASLALGRRSEAPICKSAHCAVHDTASINMAPPWPPPMHSVAMPCLTPRRFMALTRCSTMRLPLAPTGWPRPMAPP